ncbi:hypothetical protein HZQ04_15885 [Elizabethkingia anophelis]|nr:hypothetical protein [Elizabethkingia anophelis]
MKSNELRIGNYVEYAGVICKVEGYSNEGLETNGVVAPISAYNPIQLTEEWLIKFGFQNYEAERYTPNQEDSEFFEYRLASGISYRDYICKPYHGWVIKLGDYDDSLEIMFVHQMQNIYFALNGEELTIKE